MADQTPSTIVLQEVLQTIKDKLINDNGWTLSLEYNVPSCTYHIQTESDQMDFGMTASGSEYNITLTLSTELSYDHKFQIDIYISDKNGQKIESYTYLKLSDKSEEMEIFGKYTNEIMNQYLERIPKILDSSES